MSINDLLIEKGIKRALIVDDVCDEIPTANDIDPRNEAWPIFNDDLPEEHRRKIAEKYPLASNSRFDELIYDDGYVAAIWELRSELGNICEPIFATYISDQDSDLKYIKQAVSGLERFGLDCKTSGRNFIDLTETADLILIDLFFNKTQDEISVSESTKTLRQALDSRRENPPLVILMSRSSRLESKRDSFRDEVGLLDSAFRIIRKTDLEKSDFLERQLRRLAENATDSRRLSTFFLKLESGMQEATKRTLKLLRRLRLSDISQIQQLLLFAEGEPSGSYLVDVFDRILQHEIERDSGIIDAAVELNHFSIARHPSPYVAGTPELQELVERLLTQNVERLRLPGAMEAPVAFGDILMITQAAKIESLQSELLVELTPDNVLLVLTPACDLQRCSVPRVLLLVGTAKPLNAENWSYSGDARTAAIRIGNELKWIKWDLKHIDTVSIAQLKRVLEENNLAITARLREAHAMELQQRVLSGLGRVGMIAALPATFLVDVEVFYPNAQNLPEKLPVSALGEGAVCFVGRDENSKSVLRLIMTDHCCDSIIDAYSALKEEEIASRAKAVFNHLRNSEDLRKMLTEGIELKIATPDNWSHIPSITKNTQFPKIGLLAWNYTQTSDELEPKLLSKAGIIFLVKDQSKGEGPGYNEAVRSGLVQQNSNAE